MANFSKRPISSLTFAVILLGAAYAQPWNEDLKLTIPQPNLSGFTQWQGNGHWYRATSVPAGISWNSARLAAQGEGGHLATITSSAENLFISQIASDPALYSLGYYGPWIGGSAPLPRSSPSQGWTWITGEPWSFTNWQVAEPNNSLGVENCLTLVRDDSGGQGFKWNDLRESGLPPEGGSPYARGYVTEAEAYRNFGWSVDVEGSRAVIGSNGAAYVFQSAGSGIWNLEAVLKASDQILGNDFGHAVSVSGDIIVVGAHAEGLTNETGAAYVFERSQAGQWTQTAKLTPQGGGLSTRFGFSVSVQNSRVVVGASKHDTNGLQDAGAVYVFSRSGGGTWVQEAVLVNTDSQAQDWLGTSVDQSGDRIIAGSLQNYLGGRAGAAYVFAKDGSGTWVQEAKLLSNDLSSEDNLGYSVGIDGNLAIVSAARKFNSAGKAYIFARNGINWTQEASLMPPSSAPADYFGHRVAISGSRVIVGSPFRDTAGLPDSGCAFIYARQAPSTWALEDELTASDKSSGAAFGNVVSISGATVLVGAFASLEQEVSGAGSAYVFSRTNTIKTISGRLELGDYIGDVTAQPITFELRSPGQSSALYVRIVNPAPDGSYSFTVNSAAIVAGAYDIAGKGGNWLRRRLANVTLTSTGATDVDFTGSAALVNGDVDGDNEVGISDYAMLSAAYGSIPGDANWLANADLNGDMSVDIADYAILSANYGSFGD